MVLMLQMLQQSNLSMVTDVLLYGASGHCKVVIDIAEQCNFNIKYIIDDNCSVQAILGKRVYVPSAIQISPLDKLLISIGNNEIRANLAKHIQATFITCVHPKAIISEYSSIDVGSIVMAGVIINADVKIAKHCIINSGAVIEHDCVVGDYAHISPNVSLAGNVQIGEGCHVGIGATVIQGVKIGKWSIIGAGAVIIKDVPDFAVVVGNPGKIIKYKEYINE